MAWTNLANSIQPRERMRVKGELLARFLENFREHGELGASLSVWRDGVEWIAASDGWCEREQIRPWTADTLVPVYSATKGPAASALLVALDLHGLGVDTPVREVWPRFPLPEASFAHLLSHQCGLAALDRNTCGWDHAAVVAAIEAQSPAWSPGHGHGYHPRTFGTLVDEPVRRLTGMTLGAWWRSAIADPLELDFWIGLPEAQWHRVARLYPGRAATGDYADEFYRQFQTKDSLTRRAFHSPTGLHAVHEMNEPKAWAAGWAALGGVGTASALAKFYQAAIGALPGPLTESVRQALALPRVTGFDRVLLRETVFTCGCQRDPLDTAGTKLRHLYGSSVAAFGHPGAGGSHAFGDPATGISFAYVMNRMELSVMPGQRCQELVAAIFPQHGNSC